ncbi:MAG: TraR/DksA family transcriptional regulator [Bryobacteraceae bacterium]
MRTNTEELKRQLLEKQEDLLGVISRLEEEARNSRSAEVEDPIDQVISSEGKAAGFQESTLAAATLAQVREALRRMEEGTYGTCLDCGKPIEPARLNAIPWTPHCLADQEKHDESAVASGSSTL